MAKFKVNEVVTWGSGGPRALIDSFDAEFDDAGNVIEFAVLVLTRDYNTPCGKVIPTGTFLDLPVKDLHTLQ